MGGSGAAALSAHDGACCQPALAAAGLWHQQHHLLFLFCKPSVLYCLSLRKLLRLTSSMLTWARGGARADLPAASVIHLFVIRSGVNAGSEDGSGVGVHWGSSFRLHE